MVRRKGAASSRRADRCVGAIAATFSGTTAIPVSVPTRVPAGPWPDGSHAMAAVTPGLGEERPPRHGEVYVLHLGISILHAAPRRTTDGAPTRAPMRGGPVGLS
ncbi:hypothetical protein [Streptomyces sp900116325]|uniref:hypothetical protein n=1 Tax=Streptomyces sp. 900116325 TaxID=3154295 RepID=UPI003327C83B